MSPYLIHTARLTLRCLEPADASLLSAVTAANEQHLAPWMPWAHELPRPLERTRDHLRRLRAEFDRGHDFNYGIWGRADGALVGGLGIHPRGGPGIYEVGYWIDRGRTGLGYATEAAGAATRVALERLDAERVDIHVQPDNVVSLRIPERLGFRRVRLSRNRLQWRDGTWRDQVVWSLRSGELSNTPAGAIRYDAFEEAGVGGAAR